FALDGAAGAHADDGGDDDVDRDDVDDVLGTGLLRRAKTEAQGRLGQRVPIAIIDIGSNSIRQVVYEGLTRAPSILFNEKVLCGLGKGVARTGALEEMAAERALNAIQRFYRVGKQLGVEETHVLATAATREASNGAEFISRIEAITGQKIRLLSGRMEAEYAAFGIKSGFFKPEGIAGDLGGGSMELIEVNGNVTNGVTTPLGGLRLQELSGADLKVALKIARKTVQSVNVNWPGESRTFFAIGGTWRSLARLHMLENGHPVDVVHGYSIPASDYIEFCEKITSGLQDTFANIDEISKNRRPLLPFGAAVMVAVIEHLGVETVSTSAVGLREGYMYSLLDEDIREKDALLEATAELSILRARSPVYCRELSDWTERALAEFGLEESESQRRWRIAACNLADIAWRSASDFRAEQTLGIINNAGFNSIRHEGRAYLALVTFHRYQGLGAKKTPPDIAALASDSTIKLARVTAALFRVAYLFSAAIEGVLPRLTFSRNEEGELILKVPKDISEMNGEKPQSRVEALARELGESMVILTEES
ncbi:MAG: Ppx/GppA phosphatase family protein, partial [Pseudomonadota bacterium]